jgi:hypothetical protein
MANQPATIAVRYGRVTAIALSLVLLTGTAAFSQTPAPTPSRNAALTHRGHAKMAVGAALIGFGLFVVPAQGPATERRLSPTAVGATMVGGSLIFWGLRDVQRAQQPSLTFGVSTGRGKAIHVRRQW